MAARILGPVSTPGVTNAPMRCSIASWRTPGAAYRLQRPIDVPLKGEYAKPETDEQLYERKYQESRRPKPGGGTTTFSSIALEGVHTPVALAHPHEPDAPEYIAGGHHRVAVMRNLNPDQYLPVMHVRSVGEAKGLGM